MPSIVNKDISIAKRWVCIRPEHVRYLKQRAHRRRRRRINQDMHELTKEANSYDLDDEWDVIDLKADEGLTGWDIS